MIQEGLLDEATNLYDLHIKTKAVMTPIGYKELFRYFDGEVSLDEAISDIKTHSRRYAKRQYTWFNNKMNLKWFKTNYEDFGQTENEVLEYVNKEISRRPSGLRKTRNLLNSLAHKTTWLRSDLLC